MDIIHAESTSDIERAVAEVILVHREKTVFIKKTTTIGFRASSDLKESFIEACAGQEYSLVLEMLVEKFIESSKQTQALSLVADFISVN